MYLVKNALRSLTRNAVRNLFIGLIVLVIAVSCCISLSIRQAANRARESGLQNMEITAQISLNRQSLMGEPGQQTDRDNLREALQSAEELSLEEMQNYATASSVKSFTYFASASLNGTDGLLEPVETSSSTDESVQQSAISERNEQGPKAMDGMGQQGDFTLTGYSSRQAMTAFQEGTAAITDGSMFAEDTSDAVCVVSDELATYNNLKVGDIITLANPNNEAETYTLTITGIYHNSTSTVNTDTGMRGFSAAFDPANQIYTSYPALATITSASAATATTETDSTTGQVKTTALRQQLSGTYHFADLAAYEQFTQQVQEMGLSENYTVNSSDVTSFEQRLVPLENLSQFATTFFWLVLGIGGTILIILTLLAIRERQYEIGVLTAIGMHKSKVAFQFVMELFAVTLVAVLLGTGIGAAVSVPTTNALLAAQTTSQQQQQQMQNNRFNGGNSQPGNVQPPDSAQEQQAVTSITSATDFQVVIQLIGVALLLTVCAGTVSAVLVMRYDPLTILSNRD